MVNDVADDRWEAGTKHNVESVRLVHAIQKLDIKYCLDLKLGGDGDTGETLAYFLDELIDRGVVILAVNAGFLDD